MKKIIVCTLLLILTSACNIGLLGDPIQSTTLEHEKRNLSQHWNEPNPGNYTLVIENISPNDGYYELPTTAEILNITLDFTFTGSDLLINDLNSSTAHSYRLEIQLWSMDSNHEKVKHHDGLIQETFRPTNGDPDQNYGDYTYSSSFTMISTESSPHQSRIHGCYWVEFSVKMNKTTAHESGISQRVNFGEVCPNVDSDGDGWTNEQENNTFSDWLDGNVTPLTIIHNLMKDNLTNSRNYERAVEDYNTLLSDYNNLTTVDSDGDSWSDEQENLTGSIWNNGSSTPVTIINSLNDLLYQCNRGWDETINSEQKCQEELYVCENDLEDCKENVATCITVADCEDFDSDGDGWRDQVEILCGSDQSNKSSFPVTHDESICWELADDDLDGVRNMDDKCNQIHNNSEHSVDSQGCVVECPECLVDENLAVKPSTEEEIDITGGGDVTDLVFIGGTSLLAGVGITSILNRPDWKFKKPELSKGNKEKIKDLVEDIDLDFDFNSDTDKEIKNPKPITKQTETPSDQYFQIGVQRQESMTSAADPLFDDYVSED